MNFFAEFTIELKTNELPFEQEKVGPGLNMDPSQSIRPDGGKSCLFSEPAGPFIYP